MGGFLAHDSVCVLDTSSRPKLGKREAATKMLVQRGLHTMRRLLEKDTPHD
jgi:hypothetical protein